MPTISARFRSLFTPLLLAGLTLLYFAPFVHSPTGREALDGHDLIAFQYPHLFFFFDSVREGRGLPLWNPYLLSGQSIFGVPPTMMFYPPAWVSILPLGVQRGLSWLVVFHVWLGAWGLSRFTRQLGASTAGALAGGAVYGFSSVIGAHLWAGHTDYVLSQAWLPWIAVAYLRGLGQRHWLLGGLPGAAAFGLCALTGYAQMLYFAGLLLLALWMYAWLSAKVTTSTERLQVAWRTLRPLLVIGFGGAILAAVLLLPLVEFTLRSNRFLDAGVSFSNSYALPGSQLITLVFPNLFGHPNHPAGYWGQPFYEELTAYVGILPLVAMFLTRRRPAKTLLVTLIVLGVVVSLGVDGGLFLALYRLLPGYRLFRVPARALYFTVVGAAGLLALLLSDLQTASPEERIKLLRPALRWGLPLSAGAALAASFGFGVYFIVNSTNPNLPWRALHIANVLGIAALAMGAAWLALRLWRDAARTKLHWALAVAILVAVVDVWRISAPLVSVSLPDTPDPWRTLAQVAPGAPDYRVMTVPNLVGWQDGATYTHHLNVDGYVSIYDSAYQHLLDAAQNNPTSPVARLLGVRYALSNAPLELPGLTLAAQEGAWRVYQTPAALPRTFIAPEIQELPAATARQQIESGSIDLATTAIVDHPVNCAPAADYSAQTGGPSAAQIVRYEPNIVEIAAESGSAAVLVLTDGYDPAWRVTVDGAPAELLRVDLALRGVCLPGGAHRVRFEYRPASLLFGAGIAGVGWLALGAIGLARLVRRRGSGSRMGLHATIDK